MLRAAKIAGILLAFTAFGASAEPEVKTSDLVLLTNLGAWRVYQNLPADTCIATGDYAGGASLFWHWKPRNERSYFFYTDKNMSSIEDGKKYEIEVIFVNSNTRKLDDGWGTREATGNRNDDGEPEIVFSLPGDEVVADMASNTILAMKYKGKIVASLALDGTAKVAAEMRRCAATVLKNHPVDPFEE